MREWIGRPLLDIGFVVLSVLMMEMADEY